MSIDDLETGDFVLFNPFESNATGTTVIGCVLRPMVQTEIDTFFGVGGPPGWVIFADPSAHFFAQAADILSIAKSHKTAADDLGPLVSPPVPNPIG